jgi:hypothetical protein
MALLQMSSEVTQSDFTSTDPFLTPYIHIFAPWALPRKRMNAT